MLAELALGSLADLGLAPLLKWPGGKYRFAHKVKHDLPPHDVYVEPFFGGGGLFFVKDEAPLSILGDITLRTIRFHNAVRNGALRRCRDGVRLSRAAIERGARSNASACEILAAAGGGYHGMRRFSPLDAARNPHAYGAVKLRSLDEYEGMLRRAFLTQGDYRRTVKLGEKRGGNRAFYFLDPPWPGIGDYSKRYEDIGGRGVHDVTPEAVRRTMDGVSGKVWVIYNDHPDVREAFSTRRWRLYEVPMQTADPNRGGMRETMWLLATNYQLPKGALRR